MLENDGMDTKPLLQVEGLKKYYTAKSGIFSRNIGEIRAVDGAVHFDILLLFRTHLILPALGQPDNIGPVPPEGHDGYHRRNPVEFKP